MKFSKFSIIIRIDYSTTVEICEQKLITTTNFFIRSNIRFVKVFQYLSQFSFDVRHKFEENNVISNVFSKLSNTDTVLFETKNYSELKALYVVREWDVCLKELMMDRE